VFKVIPINVTTRTSLEDYIEDILILVEVYKRARVSRLN
jgi:hypothetical protein